MLCMELKVDKCHKYPTPDLDLCVQILLLVPLEGKADGEFQLWSQLLQNLQEWEAGCRLMPVQFAGGTRTLCPHSQVQAGSGRMPCLWSSPALPGRAPSRGSGSAQGKGELSPPGHRPSTQGQRELMDCSCGRDFSWYKQVFVSLGKRIKSLQTTDIWDSQEVAVVPSTYCFMLRAMFPNKRQSREEQDMSPSTVRDFPL